MQTTAVCLVLHSLPAGTHFFYDSNGILFFFLFIPIFQLHPTYIVLLPSAMAGLLLLPSATTGLLLLSSATTGLLLLPSATTGLLLLPSAMAGLLLLPSATTGLLLLPSMTALLPPLLLLWQDYCFSLLLW